MFVIDFLSAWLDHEFVNLLVFAIAFVFDYWLREEPAETWLS
jgi:hypothetical protein